MKLEALCSINGGVYNYDPKEDKGDIFEVSTKEGEALINAGAARKAASASKPTKPKQPKKIVDIKASRVGIIAKRKVAEEVVEKRKERKS